MNKQALIFLVALFLAGQAVAVGPTFFYGDQKVWSCAPPVARTDGTAIAGVLEFSLFLTHTDGTTIAQTGLTTCGAVSDLLVPMPEGQWEGFFTATEVTDVGRESALSSPPVPFMLQTFTAPPNAPTNVIVE